MEKIFASVQFLVFGVIFGLFKLTTQFLKQINLKYCPSRNSNPQQYAIENTVRKRNWLVIGVDKMFQIKVDQLLQNDPKVAKYASK